MADVAFLSLDERIHYMSRMHLQQYFIIMPTLRMSYHVPWQVHTKPPIRQSK